MPLLSARGNPQGTGAGKATPRGSGSSQSAAGGGSTGGQIAAGGKTEQPLSPIAGSCTSGVGGGTGDDSVSQVEMEALKRVFTWMDSNNDDRLTASEILDVSAKLGHPLSKREVELMVWEVDEDLDGVVSWDEFLVMYQRCIADKSGLEPRELYNLVQFLMYDKDLSGSISVEQTLQILFVRFGREMLDQEIQAIFGEEERGADGREKRITYPEYLSRVHARLWKIRNTKKGVTYPKLPSKVPAVPSVS